MMVSTLPTASELDEALARAAAAYAVRFPSARIRLPAFFTEWCRNYIALGGDLGPWISAEVIGIPDARRLADGFDLAMRQHGHAARARRVGF